MSAFGIPRNDHLWHKLHVKYLEYLRMEACDVRSMVNGTPYRRAWLAAVPTCLRCGIVVLLSSVFQVIAEPGMDSLFISSAHFRVTFNHLPFPSHLCDVCSLTVCLSSWYLLWCSTYLWNWTRPQISFKGRWMSRWWTERAESTHPSVWLTVWLNEGYR